MSETEQELKVQFLTFVLSLIKTSIDYRIQGHHWEALEQLETIINVLVVTDRDRRKALESILEYIESIRAGSRHYVFTQFQHSHRQASRALTIRNREANRVYNSVLRAIQDELTALQYYSFLGGQDANPTARNNVSGIKPRRGLPHSLSSRIEPDAE